MLWIKNKVVIVKKSQTDTNLLPRVLVQVKQRLITRYNIHRENLSKRHGRCIIIKELSENIKIENTDRAANRGVEAYGQPSGVTKEGKPKSVKDFPFKAMPIDVYVQKANAKTRNVQQQKYFSVLKPM